LCRHATILCARGNALAYSLKQSVPTNGRPPVCASRPRHAVIGAISTPDLGLRSARSGELVVKNGKFRDEDRLHGRWRTFLSLLSAESRIIVTLTRMIGRTALQQ
jgi:hypothetical protein